MKLLLHVSFDVGLSGRHVDGTDAPNLPTVDPAVFFGRCDKPDVFVQIDNRFVLAGRRYSANMRCDPLTKPSETLTRGADLAHHWRELARQAETLDADEALPDRNDGK